MLRLVAAPYADEDLQALQRAYVAAPPPQRTHPLGHFTYGGVLEVLNQWEAECLAPGGSSHRVRVTLSGGPGPRDPANEAALELYWERSASTASEVLRELPAWSCRVQERAADELLDAYNNLQ